MDAALVVALIALAGSIVNTVATVFWSPWLQARRQAAATLDTYREPLLAAAYELQARLHNILRGTFVDAYLVGDGGGKRQAAIESTLYVFAQYFGWREVIRREVQVLRFSRDNQTREIGQLLSRICEAFLASEYGAQFMIWRVEQRGLGERMIETSHTGLRCLGYASFIDQRGTMQRWLAPIEHDLGDIDAGGRRRLTEIQHLLLQLVRQLDIDHTRYPQNLSEA